MNTPLELRGARTGNCLRVSIALEEASIPYSVTRLDLVDGSQRSPEHLALNPAGRVPTIVDRSRRAGPFVLSQSNAILLWIDERRPGLLLPSGDADRRALALERFLYFVTDVIGPSRAAFDLHKDGDASSSAILDERAMRAAAFSEVYLAGAPFMAGEAFSLADVVGWTITNSMRSRLDWERMPELRGWFDRVEARPSVQRGLHAFDPPDHI